MKPRRKYPKPGEEPFNASPKDMKDAWKPVAIPTTYNGVNFKSRLEAQFAYMMDTFAIQWEYEPESIMLPNGVCYTPDFWLATQQTIVECRGYNSSKGRMQIEGFGGIIQNGEPGLSRPLACVTTFIVITSDGESLVYRSGVTDTIDPGVMLAYCGRCNEHYIGGFNADGCLVCNGETSCLEAIYVINTQNGKLLIDHIPHELFRPPQEGR